MKELLLAVSFVFVNLNPLPGQTKAPATSQTKAPATTPAPAPVQTASEAVLATFNKLIDGVRHADVKAVTSVYENSPRLNLYNYNGSVTKGWEQMRMNRESSYPEIKDVDLKLRDVNVTMLGRDGAVVTALWTQSQIYKGTPETASGRMTVVFKRVGTAWKAIHLHSSPDQPNPAVIPPSERSTASPAPTASPTPTATPTPTP
jgi:ketosteroid isomerase-like protein